MSLYRNDQKSFKNQPCIAKIINTDDDDDDEEEDDYEDDDIDDVDYDSDDTDDDCDLEDLLSNPASWPSLNTVRA